MPELARQHTDGVIDRSTTRDTPYDTVTLKGRAAVWNSRRGNHLGQRSRASATTGRTYGRKRSDQNTAKSSCEEGAVHICVVVMRQRGGKTVTDVVKHEAEAVPIIRRRVARGSIVHADEARAWDDLHATFEMKRIDHGQAYSANGACTNQAESYFSRLRRAEIGQHHHIAGPHLDQYAGEMAWREDMRRKATGAQFNACGRSVLGHPPSRRWVGYWQRHLQKEELRQAA